MAGIKTLVLALGALFLSACAQVPQVNPTKTTKQVTTNSVTPAVTATASANIDRSIRAVSQEPRVQFIILHYTALDEPTSLRVLSQQGVSSHYLVGNELPVKVWQLVDEDQMSYHAGSSDWKGYSRLNASSIGIEIVNYGYKETPDGRIYFPFPQEQIDRVISLVAELKKKYQIRPEYILGHSDIAPQRKSDPGPLFPWKQLADAGLINWPDADRVAQKMIEYTNQVPEISWFQTRLSKLGFAQAINGNLDKATKNVLIAFQMKYRPSKFDGEPDAETAALLDALTELGKGP